MTLPICRCLDCGLVYTAARPRADDMAAYYPADYVPHAASAPAPIRLRRRLRPYLSGIDAYRLEPGRLLDVGCGAGNLLREMSNRGWQVAGVEFVPAAAERASRYGEVVAGDWSAAVAHWPAGTFDVISMIHSLEHMHQPLDAARELRRLLRPGGRLIVEVPNVASPIPALFGEPWYSLPHHLYHFSPATLERLLIAAGYELARRRPVFWPTSIASLLTARLGIANSRRLYLGVAAPLSLLLCFIGRSDVISVEAVKPPAP